MATVVDCGTADPLGYTYAEDFRRIHSQVEVLEKSKSLRPKFEVFLWQHPHSDKAAMRNIYMRKLHTKI